MLPKVLALALAMPLDTTWTCRVMLVGGMLAARAELGIDPLQFLRALPGSVPASNLALGLGKSVGFGAVIAFVACHFGLRVKPDTESLAAGTTASVVSSITAVIMLDALWPCCSPTWVSDDDSRDRTQWPALDSRPGRAR